MYNNNGYGNQSQNGGGGYRSNNYHNNNNMNRVPKRIYVDGLPVDVRQLFFFFKFQDTICTLVLIWTQLKNK